MDTPSNAIDVGLVQRIFRYQDGRLVWRERSREDHPADVRRWNGRYANKPIYGRISRTGYQEVRFLSYRASAHRIVWALHHGSWPKEVIDHINRNKLDNRIENLRDVSPAVNSRNRGPNPSTEIYPPVGRGRIEKHRAKWRVRFILNGRRLSIGGFETRAEADAARIGASWALSLPDLRP